MTQTPVESLGIKRLESVHYYVRDLERSRRFYTGQMDFAEIGGSSPELTGAGRQRSVVFMAGNCVVVCSAPEGEGGRAWRYLQKHPDGIGTLIFEVEDVERTFALLERRGGTPIDEITDGRGRAAARSASSRSRRRSATPRSASCEREGFTPLFPGFEPAAAAPAAAEPLRLPRVRSRHVELPDHEPGAPVARARDGLRALLGGRVPHRRRHAGRRRTAPGCARS